MTDRHSGYVVVLDENIRDDDAKETITALNMVKGVVSVTPILSNPNAEFAVEHRVKHAMRNKLLKWFDDLK